MAVLIALPACATVEPQRTVDSACLSFNPLTYANAKAGQEAADDPGNRYDTAETILGIAMFNAALRRVCSAAPKDTS